MTDAKKKTRKKKTGAELKSSRLPAVRLTLSDRLYVDEQAFNSGMTTSDYVRTLALTEEVKPRKSKIEQSLIVELNRIGVNINQIAHHYNTGRAEKNTLNSVLHDLIKIMKKVDDSL